MGFGSRSSGMGSSSRSRCWRSSLFICSGWIAKQAKFTALRRSEEIDHLLVKRFAKNPADHFDARFQLSAFVHPKIGIEIADSRVPRDFAFPTSFATTVAPMGLDNEAGWNTLSAFTGFPGVDIPHTKARCVNEFYHLGVSVSLYGSPRPQTDLIFKRHSERCQGPSTADYLFN